MMNKFLVALVILFSSAALNATTEDPIVVKLTTASSLMPLYLGNMIKEQAGLPAEYVAKLQTILEFDLSHNGMTYLVPRTTDKEDILGRIKETQLPSSDQLRRLDAHYVVKVEVINQKLYATLVSTNSQSSKKVDGLPLTWVLKDDRRQIHQLADLINKALFGSDGIASTHFLYTVKSQDPTTKKWIADVWEADYDGANTRQVTRNMGYCVTPTYVTPKPGYASGSFFYVSYLIGQPKIYMASLKNNGQGQRFTPLKGNQLMPAISRQRNKVSFICDVTGNPDLFLQDFSPEEGALGKPRQIFSTHLATQGTPTFSPDGKRIAFVSNKDGSPKIYVMDIPAEGVSLKDIKAKVITRHTKEGTAPAWSPDGSKIAYCAMTGGARQIWIYDCNRDEDRQLTQGSGNKENPTWAPNSLHLIFNSTGNNGSELYLINLNQPDAVKLSSGPGEKRFPAWEPRP